MIQLKEIRGYADEIAREFAPDRIVLFGSYADGSAGDDSDVDLLVIMSHDGRSVDLSLEIDERNRRRVDRQKPKATSPQRRVNGAHGKTATAMPCVFTRNSVLRSTSRVFSNRMASALPRPMTLPCS